MRVFTLALAFVFMVPGVAWTADLLYVSLGTANMVVRFDVGLSSPASIQSSATIFASTNLNDPLGLVFDKAGNLYVANNSGTNGSNSISKFNSSGVYLSSITTNVSAPNGLVFDNAGNLYAANWLNSTVSKFSSSGIYQPGGSISGNVNGPRGLAFDNAGNLYVSNWFGATISKFNSSGVYLSLLTGNLSNTGGIAFDSSGKLYAVNQGNNSVSVFDSSGGYLHSITTNLSDSVGIAFDSAGNFYVSNNTGAFANTISKFNSSGVHQFSWSTGANTSPTFLTIVPEPSTYILGTLAALTMAILARRRRRTGLA